MSSLDYLMMIYEYRRHDDEIKSGERLAFLSDKPIEHASEDRLNLSSYVDVVQRMICSCETPLNIGLFGSWGVGKTSILNLLKERVASIDFLKERFDFFSIDAWELSRESLRQQLLIDLNSHYGKKAFTEEEIEDKLYNIREIKVEEETEKGFLEDFGRLFCSRKFTFRFSLQS